MTKIPHEGSVTTVNRRMQLIQSSLGSTITNAATLESIYDYGLTANNGIVLSQTITVPTVGSNTGFAAVQTYTYDELNRLTSATENVTPHGGSQSQSWKQTYTFDRYGNRRFDFTSSNTTSPASNCTEAICNPTVSTSNNRLTSTGYLYDDAGNTTRDAEYRTFTYDGENKQTLVKNSFNATIGEYFYDGDGKRVKKVVPSTGETTVFVYDAAGKLIGEYSTVVASANDAKVAYLTNDHLGSPRVTTDAIGQTTSRRDFMPYGEEIARSNYGSDTVREKFATYERDAESETDFAQARTYASSAGRFTSPDPYHGSFDFVNPQTFNRFTYVINNPLFFTDPTGLFIWSKALGGNQSDEQIRSQIAKLKKGQGNAESIAELEAILSLRQQILNSMNSALEAANNPLLTKDERERIKSSIKAFGKPGKDNGVIIGVSTDSKEGGSTHTEDNKVIAAFNPSNITAANIAHEGSHVKQALEYIRSGANPSVYSTEKEAYSVGALTSVGLTTSARGISYDVTGKNGTETTIWSVNFLANGATIQQAKARIPVNIDVHLANNQNTADNQVGRSPAFPGPKGGWK